jgi:hypothetical protein
MEESKVKPFGGMMDDQSNKPRSIVQLAVGFLMGIVLGIVIGATLQAYFPQAFEWLLRP